MSGTSILTSLIENKDTVVYPGDLLAPFYDVLSSDHNKKMITVFHEGKGTHIDDYTYENKKHQVIVASRRGYVKLTKYEPPKISSLLDPTQGEADDTKEEETKEKTDSQGRTIIEYAVNVMPHEYDSTINTDMQENLPKEGDIVLARVMQINSTNKAILEILALEHSVISKDFGVGNNGNFTSSSTGGTSQLSYSVSKITSDLGEKYEAVLNGKDVRSTERDSVNIADFFQIGDIVRCKVLSIGDANFYYLSTMADDLGVVFTRSNAGVGELMYPLDWTTCFGPFTGAEENRKMAKPF